MIRTVASYNNLWSCLRPFLSIYLTWRSLRGKEDRSRKKERLGQAWKQIRPTGCLIWLHAVSAGESVAAISLAKACLKLRKTVNILITTNTLTALEHLERTKPDQTIICYQPLDHPACVCRFLAHWQPDSAVFLESDFWPNLIIEAARQNIIVQFASAQLSTTAFINWKNRPKLASQLFGAAQLICAVDDEQRQRFEQLCEPTEAALLDRRSERKPEIRIGGSLKLNNISTTVDKAFVNQLKAAAGGRPILLAASTHEPEEQLLLQASQEALRAGYQHLLIIAPRHIDRSQDIARLVPKVSQRSKDKLPRAGDNHFLADSFGEMSSLVTAADIVILGGSFVPKGGHNPLEIAALSKPLITGPSQFKNKAEFDRLQKYGQCVTVKDKAALVKQLVIWLEALRSVSRAVPQDNLDKARAYVKQACERPAKTARLIIDRLPAKHSPNQN